MLSKVLKITGLVIGGVSVVFAITYLLLMMFFIERFKTHTYVNGIDATGLTTSELSDLLTDNYYDDFCFTISDCGGNEYTLSGEDIGFEPNYSVELSDILNSQNPLTWPENVMFRSDYSVEPHTFFYDQDKFNDYLENIDPFSEYDNEKADVYIKQDLGKYFLVDNTKPVLDKNKAKALISNSLINGETTVKLDECYKPVEYTYSQKKTKELFDKIDVYQNSNITYVDDEICRNLNFTELNKWLLKDEGGMPYVKDGKLAIDEEKINNFVSSLANSFDTADNSIVWTRKNGTKVNLPFHGNGFKVDISKESDWIKEKIYSGKRYERKPIYAQKAPGRGNKIVGDTYIEVDFEHQKMYCYIDGKLKLSSDCVTGNLSHHNDTPAMVSTIYFMQKNRTLVGENYRTFVYDWMAFYKAYGLHDATWRSSFGGEIYKTSGSHGCVNLPKDVADQLYELAYVGMPVVLYYGEDYDR